MLECAVPHVQRRGYRLLIADDKPRSPDLHTRSTDLQACAHKYKPSVLACMHLACHSGARHPETGEQALAGTSTASSHAGHCISHHQSSNRFLLAVLSPVQGTREEGDLQSS